MIIREDKNGIVIPNYEEIDYKYIHIKSGTELYSNNIGLKEYLISSGNEVVCTEKNHTFSQEQIELLNSYQQKHETQRIQATETIYKLIKAEEAKGKFNSSCIDFRQLMYESTGTAKKLISFYNEFNDSEALRKSKGDEQFMNEYRIANAFKNLNNNHTFKAKMNEAFKLNSKHLNTEIADKINKINSEELIGSKSLTPNRAVEHLRKFYNIARCKINSKASKRLDGWIILGIAA